MPNLGTILKSEISRLARRAMRPQYLALKKDVAALKHAVARHRREIATLNRHNARLVADLNDRIAAPPAAPPEVVAKSHLGPRSISANRKRLGLSRKAFALLLGANPTSVFQWESGKSKPRAKAKAALIGIRELGRREAQTRLAALDTRNGHASGRKSK